MKVVFDTNIYISAFAIPGGKAEDAYFYAVKGKIKLYTSIPILTETARILQTKFKWDRLHITKLLKTINRTATVVISQKNIHILQDEPDNRILECAVKADANFIVTGDKELLALEKFKNTDIISLASFIEKI